MPAQTTEAYAGLLVDLDGDGDLDLFTAQATAAPTTLGLFLNDGFGRFDAQAVPPSWSINGYRPTAGDIDGDGDLDIAMPGGILVNRGALGPQLFAINLGHTVLECADFTGDGMADVLTLGPTTGTLWRSRGNATFTAMAIPTMPGTPADTATADLDGDGDLDVILGFVHSPGFGPFFPPVPGFEQVWRNDGLGNFTDVTTQWFPANQDDRTYYVVAGDFDGDGDADCALCGGPGGSWIVRRNDGTGVLQLWSGAASSDYGNVAIDLDADGDLDLPGWHSWLRNDGSGLFTPLQWSTPHEFVLHDVGDVNGDGRPDLVCFGYDPRGLERLFLNRLPAPFVDATRLGGVPLSVGNVEIAVGDPDRDGDQDLLRPGGALHLNDGSGAWTPTPAPWAATAVVARFADVDRDGDQDVLHIDSTGGSSATFRVERNVGPGFAFAGAQPVSGFAMLPFDADNDGAPDVLLHGMRLLRNNGFGAYFLDPNVPVGGASCTPFAAADFDADGDLDVLAANAQLNMFVNNGTGAFTWTPTRLGVIPGQVGPFTIVPFDADGDGDLDVFFGQLYGSANSTPPVYLLRNIGGVLAIASGLLPSTSLQVRDAAAADLDEDGDVDLVVATMSGVTWWRNDGTGRMTDVGQFLGYISNQTPLTLADFDGDGDTDLTVNEHLFVNRTWHASAPYVAQTGVDYVVDLGSAALPNCVAVPFLGPRARLPVPPFGTIGLDLAQVVPLWLTQITGGSGRLSLPIPASGSLVGIEFGVQAILMDSTRMHLSPVVYDTVLF